MSRHFLEDVIEAPVAMGDTGLRYSRQPVKRPEGTHLREGLRDMLALIGVWAKRHHRVGDLTMAEIGSFAGESMEIFAESRLFKDITCVDTWKVSPSHPEEHQAERRFSKTASNMLTLGVHVQKWKGRSSDAAADFVLRDKKFDLVYIDANHSYKSVCQDITAWRPLVRKLSEGGAGILCGHDYVDRCPGVVRACVELLGPPYLVFHDWSWLYVLE